VTNDTPPETSGKPDIQWVSAVAIGLAVKAKGGFGFARSFRKKTK